MRRFFLSVSLLAMISACDQTASQKDEAALPPVASEIISLAVAEPSRGQYEISWTLSGAGPVAIEAYTDPSASDGSGVIIDAEFEGSTVNWSAPDDNQRYYFRITPSGGNAEIAAARLLPLEGGRNFRDLGGYETQTGQSIAWGKLYRSGVMAELTSADYEYLDRLGIKVICDLRSAAERTHEPTNWAAAPVEMLTFPDPVSDNASLLGAIFQKPDLSADDVKAAMAGFYRETLFQQDVAYSAMFAALATDETPLTFHCSAGKDRTGVGAAMVLAALGVPEASIVEDYVLSDKIVDYRKEMNLDAEASSPGEDPYAFLRTLPPEVVDPLLKSDAAYIQAALDEAKTRHGSVIGFIKAEYDVSDADIEAIRSNLLQP